MEDIEFKYAKIKINEFKEELKDLMNKYNFGKQEINNYNGTDDFCGTDIYFTVDGYVWYGETISEILDEVGFK